MRYLIFLILIASSCFGQTDLQGVDLFQLDFSDALNNRSDFLGFIGMDKQRIHVHFDKISQDSNLPNLYTVMGHTIVKGNRCDFKGSIVLTHVERDDLDSLLGKASGHYLFCENPEQQHVGVFQGQLNLVWQLEEGKLVGYMDNKTLANNQYEGTWSEYGQTAPKPCNWGERSIPNCGDLNVAEKGFSPNPKYRSKGW